MNAKYYPALKENSALAEKVLSSVDAKSAKHLSELIVPVYNALDDMGIDCKDTAREVAVLIFHGTYKEVNAFYNK